MKTKVQRSGLFGMALSFRGEEQFEIEFDELLDFWVIEGSEHKMNKVEVVTDKEGISDLLVFDKGRFISRIAIRKYHENLHIKGWENEEFFKFLYKEVRKFKLEEALGKGEK